MQVFQFDKMPAECFPFTMEFINERGDVVQAIEVLAPGELGFELGRNRLKITEPNGSVEWWSDRRHR